MLTSDLSFLPLIAHGFIGPSYAQLLVITWICHAAPLFLAAATADLLRALLPPTRQWDWDARVFRLALVDLVVPFAVFALVSELRVPSVAAFFLNGLVLGVAVAIVCALRCLGRNRINARIRTWGLSGMLCGLALLVGGLDLVGICD